MDSEWVQNLFRICFGGVVGFEMLAVGFEMVVWSVKCMCVKCLFWCVTCGLWVCETCFVVAKYCLLIELLINFYDSSTGDLQLAEESFFSNLFCLKVR